MAASLSFHTRCTSLCRRQEVIRLFWLFEQTANEPSAETGSIWIIIETKKVNDGHHRLKWSPLIKDYDQRLARGEPLAGVLGENAFAECFGGAFQCSAFGVAPSVWSERRISQLERPLAYRTMPELADSSNSTRAIAIVTRVRLCLRPKLARFAHFVLRLEGR